MRVHPLLWLEPATWSQAHRNTRVCTVHLEKHCGAALSVTSSCDFLFQIHPAAFRSPWSISGRGSLSYQLKATLDLSSLQFAVTGIPATETLKEYWAWSVPFHPFLKVIQSSFFKNLAVCFRCSSVDVCLLPVLGGNKHAEKISCVFWEVSQTVFAQECLFTSILFWTGVDYIKPTNESPPVWMYHSVLNNTFTYVWESVLTVTGCASDCSALVFTGQFGEKDLGLHQTFRINGTATASCSACHLSHSRLAIKKFAFAGSATLPRLKSSSIKSVLFFKFQFFHLHLWEFHLFAVFYLVCQVGFRPQVVL